jgi:hypothetical protein
LAISTQGDEKVDLWPLKPLPGDAPTVATLVAIGPSLAAEAASGPNVQAQVLEVLATLCAATTEALAQIGDASHLSEASRHDAITGLLTAHTQAVNALLNDKDLAKARQHGSTIQAIGTGFATPKTSPGRPGESSPAPERAAYDWPLGPTTEQRSHKARPNSGDSDTLGAYHVRSGPPESPSNSTHSSGTFVNASSSRASTPLGTMATPGEPRMNLSDSAPETPKARFSLFPRQTQNDQNNQNNQNKQANALWDSYFRTGAKP